MAIVSFDMFARSMVADYTNLYQQFVLCLDAAASTTKIGRIARTSCMDLLYSDGKDETLKYLIQQRQFRNIKENGSYPIANYNQCSFIPHEYTVMSV